MAIERAAVIENGVVVNVIVVETDDEGNFDFVLDGLDIMLLPVDSEVGPNWTYNGTDYSPPPEE